MTTMVVKNGSRNTNNGVKIYSGCLHKCIPKRLNASRVTDDGKNAPTNGSSTSDGKTGGIPSKDEAHPPGITGTRKFSRGVRLRDYLRRNIANKITPNDAGGTRCPFMARTKDKFTDA